MAASKFNGTISAKQAQAGIALVTVTAANSRMTKHVTFSPAFDVVPAIALDPDTAAPEVVSLSHTSVTVSGFDIKLLRTDGANDTNVSWIARIPTQ